MQSQQPARREDNVNEIVPAACKQGDDARMATTLKLLPSFGTSVGSVIE
jgi:hypothetical protein